MFFQASSPYLFPTCHLEPVHPLQTPARLAASSATPRPHLTPLLASPPCDRAHLQPPNDDKRASMPLAPTQRLPTYVPLPTPPPCQRTHQQPQRPHSTHKQPPTANA
ncbi:hypothetical protein PLICRDRAFT_175651 [Plicaturopsis crispa FD-325 SS-3]|nr:hypothetical protein PLICRDRAFT_175651 [Plicaturopsis crispa FD-325 SS-3]